MCKVGNSECAGYLHEHEKSDDSDHVIFGIVVPVHNEYKMLIQTLPSIYKLEPKEVIFVLDRCTDRTEEVLKKFWQEYGSKKAEVLLLPVKSESQWKNHLSFLYDLGIRKAKSDIILLSQADVLLDTVKIKRNIRAASDGMVSFAVLSHPHISPWNHFVNAILQMLGSFVGVSRFSGVIAVNKNQYLSCSLTADDSFNFDTQLRINYKMRHYAYRFVPTKNLNLRPWMREKLLDLGAAKYEAGNPMWKVLFFAYARFMPEVFTGYLRARLLRTTKDS